MKSIVLGCIADDFTGATDLANNLVRTGMRVVQTLGVPRTAPGTEADAIVVALKTRTVAPDDAIDQSLDALKWLRTCGARQIYFKYCSTFDSTPRGNIGPVAEALLDALAAPDGRGLAIATPAFPDNQRTVFKGYLFVGDVLLHESGMQHHPLTPMTDSNLVRVLQAQCRGKVGLVDYRVVARGADAIRERFAELQAQAVRIAIVDAVSNDDLMKLGPALKDMPLITGGSGVAIGLAGNFGVVPSNAASALPPAMGTRAIVSGSCSTATNRQVLNFIRQGGSSFRVDPLQVADGQDVEARALAWAVPLLGGGPVLIYSTAEPEAVGGVQQRVGVQRSGEMVEEVLAKTALGLVQAGVRQLIVAGGETSGACVQALQVTQMKIGPQIDPGVPWCHGPAEAVGSAGIHLALKSGNFGADDFFSRAFTLLS